MPTGNPNIGQIAKEKGTTFKPGVSGNPKGVPKGTKHLSTYIKEMLLDERLEVVTPEEIAHVKKYTKAPIAAIIMVNIHRAAQGDTKAADWLAKYGYGTKLDIDLTGDIEQRLIIETRQAGSAPKVVTREANTLEGEVIETKALTDGDAD
jgi:hypothetical protein